MKKLLLLVPFCLLAACDDATGEETPEPDAAVDAGADVDLDAELDTAPDAVSDAPADPAEDGVADGEPDVGADAEADAGTIDGRPLSPLFGQIIFNEVLMDGTAEGDPNGDGDADPVEDQFVELVNVHGSAVELAGFTLVESHLPDLARHTFAVDFSLEPDQAVVVFGGGDAPEATASATFFAANAANPGLPFGLHLSMTADDTFLLDTEGGVVARFCYGEAEGACALEPAADASLTRSPDLTGDFVSHASAAGASGAAFSPGTRVDGSPF